MSDSKGLSLRTILILLGVAVVALIAVGAIWGTGPAAGLLALLTGGGSALSWREKRKLLGDAEAARTEAAAAAREAEAAAAAHAEARKAGEAQVARLDAQIAAAPAADAAADAEARARAKAVGDAVAAAAGASDEDLLIGPSATAKQIRGES